MSVQLATRIDDKEAERFRETARRLGTTPSDALRMFVSAFNTHRGFPFDVRIEEPQTEAFATEAEATAFADYLAMQLSDHER